jgi:hypothetical protein
MWSRRVTVTLDPTQAAWLEALAAFHKCSRAQILREGLSWYAARETASISRTRYYRAMAVIEKATAWDPVSDYLAGLDTDSP